MRWIGISVSALLMTVASVACTRSFDAKYVPSMTPLQQADQLRAVRLGIGKFQDARRSVKADEPQSLSHVSRAGAWRFGLTYGGREMIPVNDLVQALFVEEFGRAGIRSSALPEVLTKDGLPAMRAAGEKASVDHVLGGRIVVFEWENEDKFWYIHSRRSVALEIHLLRVAESSLLLDTVATGTDENDEGMGVLHTTNIDRLLNRVFRLVVFKVVEEVAQKLAMDPRDVHVRVSVSTP